MPRKAFLEDLNACSSKPYENIEAIRKLDDAEIELTVIDGSGEVDEFKVFLLIPDVSQYPTSHDIYIYAADNAPAAIATAIQNPPKLSRKPLDETLNLLSIFFSNVFAGILDNQSYGENEEMDYDTENAGDEDEPFGAGIDNEDWIFSQEEAAASKLRDTRLSTSANLGTIGNIIANESRPVTEAARSDLINARVAGFKVGLLGIALPGFMCYVSIACRVGKLGISKEAMKAWMLKPAEYLMIILRYRNGYRPLKYLLDRNNELQNIKEVEIAICVSDYYKPVSVSAVEHIFLNASEGTGPTSFNTERATMLRKTFISKSLEDLLNSRLLLLISTRLNANLSWSEAQQRVYRSQGLASHNSEVDDGLLEADTPRGISRTTMADELQRSGSGASFPTVAMQFLLRHFVRCTDFCLICHCEFPNSIEALKPYVCENPLCLYQYMSLGFGPSIESEIIDQPYVVDLLVSFCYAAASSNTLSSYPTGLGFKIFDTAALDLHSELEPITRQGPTSRQAQTSTASPSMVTWGQVKRAGDIVKLPLLSDTYMVYLDTQNWEFTVEVRSQFPVEVNQCLIIQAGPNPKNTFLCSVLNFESGSTHVTVKLSRPITKAVTEKEFLNSIEGEEVEALISVFSLSFDELPSNLARNKSIIHLLDCLPTITEMRAYLKGDLRRTLSDWTWRITPAQLAMLRWIIVSNRSCIVQLDQLEMTDNNLSVSKSEERVQGVPGWIQFHFMTGSPTKESRFIKSIAEETKNQKYPTIFAWHGSPVYNWHGIIREGLNFDKVAHGRASGDGCYHSRDFALSLGYSSRNFQTFLRTGVWNKSILAIESAVALSEIINAPKKFVSQSPHYVVDALDWIQTRYLFVSPATRMSITEEPKPPAYQAQDPNHTPTGPGSKPIEIPITAVPKSRRMIAKTSNAFATETSAKKKPRLVSKNAFEEDDEDDISSITTEDGDRELLLEYSDALEHQNERRPRISEPCTDFNPSALQDFNARLLPTPSYATFAATKRLQKDLLSVLTTQNDHQKTGRLAELGWYVSQDQITKTDNLYQWLVHLHSIPLSHPLGKDMAARGLESIVLEVRFPSSYPIAPPFVRVVGPRFLPARQGGGGHVLFGGAMCIELLTNSGWSSAYSMEAVMLQIRSLILSTEPPARLETKEKKSMQPDVYGWSEAVQGFKRAASMHGWVLDVSLNEMDQP